MTLNVEETAAYLRVGDLDLVRRFAKHAEEKLRRKTYGSCDPATIKPARAAKGKGAQKQAALSDKVAFQVNERTLHDWIDWIGTALHTPEGKAALGTLKALYGVAKARGL